MKQKRNWDILFCVLSANLKLFSTPIITLSWLTCSNIVSCLVIYAGHVTVKIEEDVADVKGVVDEEDETDEGGTREKRRVPCINMSSLAETRVPSGLSGTCLYRWEKPPPWLVQEEDRIP
jgi:hypothetical protein